MESHPAGQGRRGACHGMPKAPTGRPRRLVAGLGCAGLVVGLHLMRRRGGAGRNRRGRAYAAACDYAVPDAAVDDEVAVFVTSVAARVRALPVMLDSLMRGSLLPAAVYVVVPGDGDVRCPRPGGRTALRRLDAPAHPHVRLTVYFVRALEDRGPVEKYLGALGALPAAAPRFALVVDDDHEYDPDLVRKYSAALHRDPGVAFTVQSPARELDFEPWFPIVFGSRGVGVALATLRTGLVDFYRDAIAFEPTCRLVDDVVISAYLAANDVDVRDVSRETQRL
ncbi:hypothetical protein M885DRAFT_504906 [Pelagophyceae sp. CCMP2097]|nr:hypothetical protein M885DRAFT_504906 [Pelagophyceae sp. CCMP2097]